MNKKLVMVLASALLTHAASAATRIDLSHQSGNYIKPYVIATPTAVLNSTELRQTRTDVDFNQTSHVRLQQMYAGVPVWNATAIAHIPKANQKLGLYAHLNQHTSMTGVIYEGLGQDLGTRPTYSSSELKKKKKIKKDKLKFKKK